MGQAGNRSCCSRVLSILSGDDGLVEQLPSFLRETFLLGHSCELLGRAECQIEGEWAEGSVLWLWKTETRDGQPKNTNGFSIFGASRWKMGGKEGGKFEYAIYIHCKAHAPDILPR